MAIVNSAAMNIGVRVSFQIRGLLILDNSLAIVNTSALDTELEEMKVLVDLTTGSQRIPLSAELL